MLAVAALALVILTVALMLGSGIEGQTVSPPAPPTYTPPAMLATVAPMVQGLALLTPWCAP